ncbi:glycoside hydrolase family 2 protein [Pontiella sulfatireligans]|nr:sugar-binding domain-containing protein [Pontiella sulfatireligans]
MNDTVRVSKNRMGWVFVLLLLAFAGSAVAEKLNFNPDWRFIKEDVAGAEATGFDDSGWKQISAPHTYNDVDTFDDWSPAGHKGEMDQWGGKTWYRKHFTVPAEWRDKVVIIEFEAVRQIADAYCNGVKVGHCENGFIPFGADLTSHLKFGEPNVIAVACDNAFVKDTDFGGDRNKVWHNFMGGAKLPWNNPHWHPAHGGIYRNVFLHVSDKLHFTQPLFNNMETVGTYVYAVNPSRESTGVGIENEIVNQTGKEQPFSLRNRLLDRTGKTVLELNETTTLSAGQKKIVKSSGNLVNPELWEPGYPYLYTLVTEIIRDGQVIDRNEEPFGVRWIELTTDRGFYINDRHVKLQGWGMKSVDGWPGLGAANPDWMHYYTLKLIADSGGNFVRWGHTAGGPIHLRAADELGIVTQQPGVDGEGDTEGHAWEIRSKAWKEMVIYYRNSPSLLVWEGGNQSTSKEHTEELKSVVDFYDPYGGRVYGHRRANNVVKPYCDLTISTEGSGYIKELPTLEGEYNREESPRRVWDRHTPPYQKWHAKGSYDLSAEEYAINQLFHYQKIAPRSHGGGANWIFVDSTSGGRVETEVTRTSGEMDAMRLPKEAYHVCRVIFSDEPDIHLIGHWNYPAGTIKDINVAADCDEVSLFLNGKEIGRKQAATEMTNPLKVKKKKGSSNVAPKSWKHPMLFTFEQVEWKPGDLVAVGYKDGREVARHEVATAGPAVALKLTPLTGPTGLLADGSDAVVFDVEAIDSNGNRCPTFIERCDFTVEGPGVWRGGYNSGKIKSTNNSYLDLEAGINRVIVRSSLTSGTITLKASSKGLEPATCKVEALPIHIDGGVASHLPPIPEQGRLAPLPLPVEEAASRFVAEAQADGSFSDLIEDLSYSGPSGDARIQKTKAGAPMFSDHEQKLPKLPECLMGGEYIQLPNSEWNYSAVDLLQFNVKKSGNVYIAHDSRLETMPWMKTGFADTGKELVRGKNRWRLFSKKVTAGESVLLGSNTETKEDKRWMMVVFVVPES